MANRSLAVVGISCPLGQGAAGMTHFRYSYTYLMVAGLCCVIHNVTLIVADAFGLQLWFIIALSFAIVQPVGYLGHSLATFAQSLSWQAFFRYSAAMATNVPLAYGLVWFARDLAGLPMLIVAPLASVLISVLNYCISRWAILHSGHKKEAP